jgi:hypothetical protein
MFTIPQISTDLTPVIVTSPTIRSGTTLLQRLLCSASNAIIYGENVAQDVELFINIYISKATVYTMNQSRFDATRSNVVEHGSDEWMIDLMPDLKGYLAAIGNGCFNGLSFCREYAREQGCSVWGFKYPGWKPAALSLIQQMFPQARILYIYRDVLACARSAKAWLPSWDNTELAQFCMEWVENFSYALTLKGNSNILLLKFEDFVAHPTTSIQQIAAFTGAEAMQERVFQKKINDAANEATPYRDPTPLTEAELQIVEQYAGSLRSQLYS